MICMTICEHHLVCFSDYEQSNENGSSLLYVHTIKLLSNISFPIQHIYIFICNMTRHINLIESTTAGGGRGDMLQISSRHTMMHDTTIQDEVQTNRNDSRCDHKLRNDDDYSSMDSMAILNMKKLGTTSLPWNVIDDDTISSSSDSESTKTTDDEDDAITHDSRVKHSFSEDDEMNILRHGIESRRRKLSNTFYLLRFICMALLSGLFINWAANDLLPIAIASTKSVLARYQTPSNTATTSLSSSVYVSGGGFSGFWYTIGRLQSMDYQRKSSSEYYCYSAGCLGVIASLNNFTMEQMYGIASEKQKLWQNGHLHRYEIVPQFIDDLLSFHNKIDNDDSNNEDRQQQQDDLAHPLQDMLSRIHIITTEVHDGDDWWSFLRPKYREASTIEELKQLLIQTTWIPYAVGYGLSYNNHLDGAFSYFSHASCDYHVGLTWDIELLTNVININLSQQQVNSLWNKGLEYGV